MHPGVMFGSSFAVAMGIFAWLGHRWDEKTGRAPLGVLLGVGVGLLYGAYEVWKLIQEPRPPSTEPDAAPDAASDAEQADAAEVADTDRPS